MVDPFNLLLEPFGLSRIITHQLDRLQLNPFRPFEPSLRESVRWYRAHEAWWRPLISTADFQSFVKRFYGRAVGEDLS